MRYCTICGREGKMVKVGNEFYCNRHAEQIKRFGYALDENNRDENDLNEIVLHDDYAEIILYDNLFNPLDKSIEIDLEDLPIVQDKVWKKQGKHMVGIDDVCMYDLPNLLLDVDDKVEYVDGDIFNNRKSNLSVVKKKKFKHHLSSRKADKNKIIITSLGGSTDDVTGSCMAVEYPLDNGNRDLILIECGGIQTNRVKEDYLANKKMIDGIPFNLASHIFVQHTHIDHCQNIPAGITRGFNGNIITTYENKQLLKPMLLDATFIHNRNVMAMNNSGSKYEILFDEGDCYTALDKIVPYAKDEIHKLNSNLSFRITDNNHCVGSTQLELFVKKPSGRIVKIFYSSDFGSRFNQKYRPYSEERKDVAKANVVLMESTYGESNRCFTKKDADEEYEKLISKIKEVIYRGNRICIPCFSYDRSQSIMTCLYEEFKDDPKFKNVKVIVDSRLLNEINNVYRTILTGEKLDKWNEVLGWKNFIFNTEFKKTEILALDKDNPCVILGSAGMLSAGHILTYAKSILPRKQDCMCFVGYCSPNTTGGKIQAGAKSITIDGQSIPVRCDIEIFHTFTGHAQSKELIQFMKNVNCNNIYLHHGSKSAKENLKFMAEEDFLFSGISKKIHIIDKKHNRIVI